jgi:hypothetical protein
MKWVSVFALVIGLQAAQASPARIVIIPEAESLTGSTHLSTRGQRRAQALVSLLETNRAILNGSQASALFAARTGTGGNNCGTGTLRPFSQATGSQIRTPFAGNQSTPLARMFQFNHAFDGGTIVIAWPRDQIPQLLTALGVRNAPRATNRTDRIYIVTPTRTGATLRVVPERLLPGDSSP